MMLFQKISFAYFVARCVVELNADNLLAARQFYNSAKRWWTGDARFLALGARISILERDSATGEALLRQALSKAMQGNGNSARYVELYCRYFLSLIERRGDHEQYRIEAQSLAVKPFYTRSLPLPDQLIPLRRYPEADIDALQREG